MSGLMSKLMNSGPAPLPPVTVIWAVVAWNIVTFAVMALDKRAAKRGGQRIPEASLFTLAVAMGAPGIWLAMHLMRHKTLHMKFRVGIPLLVMVNLIGFRLLGELRPH